MDRLQGIGRLKSLRELKAERCGIEALGDIALCGGLEQLTLDENPLKSLRGLVALRNLFSLSVQACGLGNTAFRSFDKLHDLRDLSLAKNHLDDLSSIAHSFPRLSSLDVSDNAVPNDNPVDLVQQLSNFSELTDLSISGNRGWNALNKATLKETIRQALPQLIMLDGQELVRSSPPPNASNDQPDAVGASDAQVAKPEVAAPAEAQVPADVLGALQDIPQHAADYRSRLQQLKQRFQEQMRSDASTNVRTLSSSSSTVEPRSRVNARQDQPVHDDQIIAQTRARLEEFVQKAATPRATRSAATRQSTTPPHHRSLGDSVDDFAAALRSAVSGQSVPESSSSGVRTTITMPAAVATAEDSSFCTNASLNDPVAYTKVADTTLPTIVKSPTTPDNAPERAFTTAREGVASGSLDKSDESGDSSPPAITTTGLAQYTSSITSMPAPKDSSSSVSDQNGRPNEALTADDEVHSLLRAVFEDAAAEMKGPGVAHRSSTAAAIPSPHRTMAASKPASRSNGNTYLSMARERRSRRSSRAQSAPWPSHGSSRPGAVDHGRAWEFKEDNPAKRPVSASHSSTPRRPLTAGPRRGALAAALQYARLTDTVDPSTTTHAKPLAPETAHNPPLLKRPQSAQLPRAAQPERIVAIHRSTATLANSAETPLPSTKADRGREALVAGKSAAPSSYWKSRRRKQR